MRHLLFRCNIFGSVWYGIFQWLGIYFISTDSARDHLHHFGYMAGLPRSTYLFLIVICNACVWTIWKERNSRIFKQSARDLATLLDNIKFLSYSWLKANLLTSTFSYNDW